MSRTASDGSQRGDVVETIAAHLSTGIRSGELEPGSKLPTEHSLSKQFGVSRTVVREALSRIKSDGLVYSRQGSGVYVTSHAARRSFKLGEGLTDEQEILSLLELRETMEIGSARLASVRRTPDDLDRIAAAHSAMERSVDWSEEGVAADLQFHHAIAVATHNKFYADFMAFLGGALEATISAARLRSGRPEIKSITVAEHARILRAIEERNPDAAASAMISHIQGARERMLSPDR